MKILRFNDKKYSRDEFQQISANYSRKAVHSTIIAATGSGKTRIAIIRLLAMNKASSEYKAIVVVPDHQVRRSFEEKIELFNIKNVEVIVINSIVNRIKREKTITTDFLILDEVHNYATIQRSVVFTKIVRTSTLCLTATLKRLDNRHTIIERHCPVIVNVSLKVAMMQEWVNPFVVKNVYVPLLKEEAEAYQKYNDMFTKNFAHFYTSNLPRELSIIAGSPLNAMFKCIQDISFRRRLANAKNLSLEAMMGIAQQCNKGMQGRKQILLNSKAKLSMAKVIGRALPFKKGVMTFSETIAVCEQMTKILGGKAYHSKLKKEDKQKSLQKFLDGKIKYLHTATSMDEGFDIPNLNAIIIIAGKSTSRQMKQRVGRVIRLAQDKGVSIVYNLCIENSQDEKWSLKRFDGIPGANIEHIRFDELLAELR